MGSATLLNFDVEKGADLVDALARAGLKVSVALWACLAEYGDWRFVVSARQFDALNLKDAYGLFHDSSSAAGFTPYNEPPVMILPMADSFIRELRRKFAKAKSTEGMRLGGQMIGERFVEDAYVYRIS